MLSKFKIGVKKHRENLGRGVGTWVRDAGTGQWYGVRVRYDVLVRAFGTRVRCVGTGPEVLVKGGVVISCTCRLGFPCPDGGDLTRIHTEAFPQSAWRSNAKSILSTSSNWSFSLADAISIDATNAKASAATIVEGNLSKLD